MVVAVAAAALVMYSVVEAALSLGNQIRVRDDIIMTASGQSAGKALSERQIVYRCFSAMEV